MATINAYPNDFRNKQLTVLAQLTNVDMTTAAAFFVLTNNTNRTIALTHVTFEGFTSLPDGSAFPSSWAPSWGTNSTTTPTNMYNQALGSNVLTPCVVAQPMLTVSPYITLGQSLYFAVVTTTGGVGKIGTLRFCGVYLSMP